MLNWQLEEPESGNTANVESSYAVRGADMSRNCTSQEFVGLIVFVQTCFPQVKPYMVNICVVGGFDY